MRGWLGPKWFHRVQTHFQNYPGASRDWTWRIRVGNAIASVRYTLWWITLGRYE